MVHIKTKYFPILLLTSAAIVEICATFFSVYGLTKLFAGAAIYVGIMASSLEFAKVITASYVYRYWKDLGLLFKSYMVSALLILMLITSIGIYGFLSNAFQGSTLGLEKEIATLTLQEDEITRIKSDNETLKLEKKDYQSNLAQELNGLVIKEETRYSDVQRRAGVQKRYQALISDKDKQITVNNQKIGNLSQGISDAKVKMIDTGSDVGPIIFVARAFDITVTTAVQYLIILFIIVFDPLALALIIAFNKITMTSDREERGQIFANFTPETQLEPVPAVQTTGDGVLTKFWKDSAPERPKNVMSEIIDTPLEPIIETPKVEKTEVAKALEQKYEEPYHPMPSQTSSF